MLTRAAFLSYLRLAVYMAVLSVAMTLSFHLKHQPTDLERRMAKPLGVVFWVLAVVTLFMGVGNYISEPRALAPCRLMSCAEARGRNRAQVQQEGGHCADWVEDAAGRLPPRRCFVCKLQV